MIYYQEIKCPLCETTNLGKAGESAKGVQRYFCKNESLLLESKVFNIQAGSVGMGVMGVPFRRHASQEKHD